jgi:hypothetical protein
VFLVHSPHDSTKDKVAALAAWAKRFSEEAGRPPHVWFDSLCADPSLPPAELLSHLPYYIPRCRRMLVLASPGAASHPPCAFAIYLWTAMGGRLEDIEGELVRKDEPSCRATAAAFGSFDVKRATVVDPAFAPDSVLALDPAVARTVAQVADIASAGRFNRAVHELAPAVGRAIARL